MNKQTSKLAWHYTTGTKFKQIVESGYLDPKKTATPPNEKPILWFSKHQYFEPTAQKAVRLPNGQIENLGMMGTYEMGGGLIRFGYPIAKLTEYKKLCRQAGVAMLDVLSLERVGVSQGAKPTDWMGTLKKIDIQDCIIEVLSGDAWVNVKGGEV